MARKSLSLLTALVAFVLMQTVAHAVPGYRINGTVSSDRVYGYGSVFQGSTGGVVYITTGGVTYQFTINSISISGDTATVQGTGANTASMGYSVTLIVTAGNNPSVSYSISGNKTQGGGMSNRGTLKGTAIVQAK